MPNGREITILEMVDTLFPAYFSGGTWDAWRTVLAAIWALPMTENQLELYRKHTGRTDPPTKPFNDVTAIVGRQGGKTNILALIAVYLATARDYKPYLRPGQRAYIPVVAADREQAESVFRYAEGLLESDPFLAKMVQRPTSQDRIVLKNPNSGVMTEILVFAARFRSVRGRTYAGAIVDELAFLRDETSANPDTELIRALRPGLGIIPGALLLKASSPYARRGVLYSDFRKYYGHDDAPVLVWKAGTRDMNSSYPQVYIDAETERDPENALAEYGAEFRSDVAAFVPREVVEACVESGCVERPYRQSAGRYQAFVDAAGGSGQDSMTCAIAHREDGIAVLDALREIRPPFSTEDVTRDFAALFKSYGINRAESDKWGGDWVVTAFAKQGIRIDPCAKPKSDIYREALPLLNSRQCALLDIPRLISQFSDLERRTARGGRDTIDHPQGAAYHDDACNAACGALVLVGTVRPPMQVSDEAVQRARSFRPGRFSSLGQQRF